METVAFVFALFGFIAFCSMGNLKSRISDLESALRRTEGTPYAQTLQEVRALAAQLKGRAVTLSFNEEENDPDVLSCMVNYKGTVTLLDADDQWLLVRLETKAWRSPREKLIRLETVDAITPVA